MHLSRSPRAWGLAAGTIVLLLLAFGLGLTLDRPDPAPTTDTADLAPGSAAMRIRLDAETGLPAPAKAPAAAELDAELANMLSRSDEGLVPVHHPDGRVSVHLQGRFMSASLARIDENGELETTCVETLEDAQAFRRGESATPAAPKAEVR